ncbi:acetylesterase [Lactobacillus selangorensis]|uniref:Acetylesterase n=1 Tax=Lactobacillus selangorensis TaxID=81857 RepID=A0A0R2FWZ0_9LACO|nr:alpha/beta hydrolase-fold protein [Lactobacillus selangorensis]KRN28409.1 acetylesterase [Lactobacillus selangorensis]KRN31910.1 acetylesterase [Lactobacillus selangorensis]
MSLHQIDFYSNVLQKNMHLNLLLPHLKTIPQKKPHFPTLWLLHGLGGDETSWLRNTEIETLADQAGLAVVMPDADRSFYINRPGAPYWDYLTTEIFQTARALFPLAHDRKNNFVAGDSMGGYGALKWAFNQPNRFAAVAALSPVLDLKALKTAPNVALPDFKTLFAGRDLKKGPLAIPWLAKNKVLDLDVYLATADHDYLRKQALKLKPVLEKRLGERFTWRDDQGSHNWTLWKKQLPDVIHWLPLN